MGRTETHAPSSVVNAQKVHLAIKVTEHVHLAVLLAFRDQGA